MSRDTSAHARRDRKTVHSVVGIAKDSSSTDHTAKMIWYLGALAVAAAVTYVVQQAVAIFSAWMKNMKLAKTFPHIENWSFTYGTFAPRADEAHFSDMTLRFYLESTERFKDVFCTFLGPMMVTRIVVVHPDAAQIVLKRSDGKSVDYEFIRPWLGDGLLLAKGAKWFRNRKLLTPAFHFGILKTYVSSFNEATDVLLSKLSTHCRSGTEYWDVFNDVGLASLDIILRCAFSSRTNCQLDSDNDYAKAVHDLTELVLKRMMTPWQRIDQIYYLTTDGRRYQRAKNIVHKHSTSIIRDRKLALASKQGVTRLSVEDDSKQYIDFLDLLLTVKDIDGNPMPDDDIQAEVDTFLFEGHDTTKAAICWALYLCAKYPEHQEKLRSEIDDLLSGRKSEHLTWNDLSELRQTTLFVKEAMRICPPVPGMSRTTEEDLELCGRHVPKGTHVDIMIYCLHHNRHVWGDDVEEFKPERFSLENDCKMNPFAYVPFSAGPRNCIGQNMAMNELKLVLARVLRRFVVKPHPTIIPKPAFLTTLQTTPSHPMYLKLEPRAAPA